MRDWSGERIAPVASAGQYTCPMHPEVISDKPGSCPICGMALEPVAPNVAPDDHRELDDLTLASGSERSSRFRSSCSQWARWFPD